MEALVQRLDHQGGIERPDLAIALTGKRSNDLETVRKAMKLFAQQEIREQLGCVGFRRIGLGHGRSLQSQLRRSWMIRPKDQEQARMNASDVAPLAMRKAALMLRQLEDHRARNPSAEADQ